MSAAKLAVRCAALLPVALARPPQDVQLWDTPVIALEMFRAVNRNDMGRTVANVDTGSLAGVLSYVQTEAIGEHFPRDEIAKGAASASTTGRRSRRPTVAFLREGASESDHDSFPAHEDPNESEIEEHPDEIDPVAVEAGAEDDQRASPMLRATATTRRRAMRTARHRNIDVIFKRNFKVKNPPALLASRQAAYVDFGPEVSFENGEAQGKIYKWDYGDFVGATRHVDSRTPQMTPGYWFSISGACPNKIWSEKQVVHRDGSSGLDEDCMVHPSGVGHLKGGLCPNGMSFSTTPTGEIGCVYSYQADARDVVTLDDLSGLTKEDCGGRPCRDWMDFRSSCTNPEYKKVFNYGRRRTVTTSRYCIEYDIHPACVESCFSSKCKALRESEKDVGLPFWRGRCDAVRNLWRVEQLAKAFGIGGTQAEHQLVSKSISDNAQTCLHANHTRMCHPNPKYGYMYCTRAWAGVCQSCYVPGTVTTLPDANKHIPCPWNVLSNADYANREDAAPECASPSPKDLCCLYAGTCNITFSDDPLVAAGQVPLDEDGFWIMCYLQNTEAMMRYITRYHSELYGGICTDEEALREFAYWQWGIMPQLGKSFAAAIVGSKPFFEYPPTTTTTTVTTVTRTTTEYHFVPVAPTLPATTPVPIAATTPASAASALSWSGAVVAIVAMATFA